MRRLGSWILLLVAGTGCGAGQIGETGADTSGADDSTESGSDTSTGDGDGDTTGDGDGDTTGDGDGDTTGDGDGDTTGDGDCPAPGPVTAGFSLTPPEPITATCSVVGESIDARGVYEMTLDCEGADVVVELDSTIPYKPSAAGMVELDYRTELVGPNVDRWLAIHQVGGPQGLVLGGVSASDLDPPGTTLADFFGDPSLSVAAAQDCQLRSDSCGELQRLALEVSTEIGGGSELVFDHGSWFVDFLAFGYAMEVEQATRRVLPIECDDVPEEWVQLVVVWFPSD